MKHGDTSDYSGQKVQETNMEETSNYQLQLSTGLLIHVARPCRFARDDARGCEPRRLQMQVARTGGVHDALRKDSDAAVFLLGQRVRVHRRVRRVAMGNAVARRNTT